MPSGRCPILFVSTGFDDFRKLSLPKLLLGYLE